MSQRELSRYHTFHALAVSAKHKYLFVLPWSVKSCPNHAVLFSRHNGSNKNNCGTQHCDKTEPNQEAPCCLFVVHCIHTYHCGYSLQYQSYCSVESRLAKALRSSLETDCSSRRYHHHQEQIQQQPFRCSFLRRYHEPRTVRTESVSWSDNKTAKSYTYFIYTTESTRT